MTGQSGQLHPVRPRETIAAKPVVSYSQFMDGSIYAGAVPAAEGAPPASGKKYPAMQPAWRDETTRKE
ncbi:hypothetical protein CFR79_03095 [Komagataeibacter saccharivorans]|nr:hypothetical protein CFR79_03095 [Komagataeibacter saccharivorans]